MKAITMVMTVLLFLVIPVAAQVQVVPIQDPTWPQFDMNSMLLPSVPPGWFADSGGTITCPSPSTYSFAAELRRIIEAREQRLKVLRELLVELEKGWVRYDSTSGSLEFQNDVIPFTLRDAPNLLIDKTNKTITWEPKQ